MLVLKDCGIEPGDILFVVSTSSKILSRFKEFIQLGTSSQRKHGHKEVISVFVCTGENKYGVICHNFERKLRLSTDSFIDSLEEKTTEELCVRLLNYCRKEFTVEQIKKTLKNGPDWMKQAAQSQEEVSLDELVEQVLAQTYEDRDKIIQLLTTFWKATEQSETLPVVRSSLLVFKHTNNETRQQFLEKFSEQVKITEALDKKQKHRGTFWAAFKATLFPSTQDKKDRDGVAPSDETVCSSNLMQVLNQVNPDLVNRGRHVLPKSLEAGFREATKSKIKAEASESPQEEVGEIDEFEQLIAEQEQLQAPFKMVILPASGTDCIRTLVQVVDKEIYRIEHKFWINDADKQKAKELKKLLLPYRDLKLQSYPVNLQVQVALELIATLQPALKRKTGVFGSWISSTAYSRVRAFARTQGIFDGDVREAIEKLKDSPSQALQEKIDPEESEASTPLERFNNSQIYVFSDWSFSSWPSEKSEFMLEHMSKLLDEGHDLYTWENGTLIKMTKDVLLKSLNGEDFDDLLSSKLMPATRSVILGQAEQQKIDSSKIQFLDYSKTQTLADDKQSLEVTLNKVAPLFALQIDDTHLNQAKLHLIDIEMEQAKEDEKEQTKLLALKDKILAQKDINHTNYQSGADTKALISQSNRRAPIFKPIDLMTLPPSHNYLRKEVYTDLFIPENPSSSFQYFKLSGMNATKDLVDCEYQFQAKGLTQGLIKERKAQSKQTLFKGEINTTLTKEWQALPSLDPGEKLLDVAIKGLGAKDFEIKYSQKNHLHYIRLTKASAAPEEVPLNFLLQMPKHYRANPIFNTLVQNPAHQDIHQLLMKYLKFGKDRGALRDCIGTTVLNGHDYLKEAGTLEVGSCRLRAIAFKEAMQKLHPEIPVSVIGNSSHFFIEMELDGVCQRYCLGGYRDTPSLVEKVKEDTMESMGIPSKRHQFFAGLFEPKPPTPIPEKEMGKKLG